MLDDGLNEQGVFENAQVTVTHLQALLASVAGGGGGGGSSNLQGLVLNPWHWKYEAAIVTFCCLVSF